MVAPWEERHGAEKFDDNMRESLNIEEKLNEMSLKESLEKDKTIKNQKGGDK